MHYGLHGDRGQQDGPRRCAPMRKYSGDELRQLHDNKSFQECVSYMLASVKLEIAGAETAMLVHP